MQALAGILLPSATVFLLLLCNDREVLGPWINRPWLNLISGFIISVLLALSLILMATTVLPNLQVTWVALVLGALIVVGFALVGVWLMLPAQRLARKLAHAVPADPTVRRETWRMPQLALLERPVWSRTRSTAMGAMWVYLAVAAILLAVKAYQLATGH